MAQAIVWSGGKPYEYVDGALQEVRTPGTYTMPDGTKYTYGPDGQVQTLASGQTTAAPVYQGSGQGVPQWLIDQNQGQNISTGDSSPLGGNTSYTVGNQVYTGTQWQGEPGAAPWGSNSPGYYNFENTPQLQYAGNTGLLSQMNGSPYNTLDANGNVTGSGTWSNIHDDHSAGADNLVTALVGGVLGAGALGYLGGAGAAAEGVGAGAAGAGAAGAGTGAGVTGFGDAGLMYGGADAAAAGSLGGGASVAGGSALGAGAAGAGGAGAASGGAGVTGFGDAGTMYGGADAASAGSLGGGASVNGGAALGSGATAMGAPGGGGSGAGSATGATSATGTPPPANPYLTGTGAAGGLGSLGNILGGNGTASDYAGILAALGGAAAGSQGQSATQTSTQKMDPRMDALFYGSLAPQAQSLLGQQMPAAQTASNQLMSVGSGLLGQTAPTTATNPYLSSIADDMQRRTQLLLGQNNQAIQGNFVAGGGLGGSRQGVAQGVAAGQAADSLQGQIANLYGTAYAGDQNRLIQQQTLGGGLLAQGLATPWQPLQATSQLYSPFTGFGQTTNNQQQGGGLQGALGGALGAAQFGKSAGWW